MAYGSADPEAYERACLEEVIGAFERPPPNRTIHRVELRGQYAETAILVEWTDEIAGRHLSNEWPLWDDLFGSSLELRHPPSFVGTVVWANLEEI